MNRLLLATRYSLLATVLLLAPSLFAQFSGLGPLYKFTSGARKSEVAEDLYIGSGKKIHLKTGSTLHLDSGVTLEGLTGGTDGAPLFGSGAPSNGLGAVGDSYVNLSNGAVYKKTGASTWTFQLTFELSGAASTAQSNAIATAAADATAKANARAAAQTVAALPSTAITLNPTSTSDVLYTATWTGTPVTLTYTGGSDTAGEKQRLLVTVTSTTVLTVTPTSSTVYRNGSTTALGASTVSFAPGRYWIAYLTPDTGTTLLMEDSAVKASEIPLLDAGNYFTTKTIEGALQQLGAAGGGASVSDTAYDATSWDGVGSAAPSKNAIRDKIESLSSGSMPVGTSFGFNPAKGTLPTNALLADGTNGTDNLGAVNGTSTAWYTMGNGTAATPTVDVPAGTYTSAQTVTFATATPGAAVNISLNGAAPVLYTAPLVFSTTTTVTSAIASKSLWAPSAPFSGVYTIDIPTVLGFFNFNTGTIPAGWSRAGGTPANADFAWAISQIEGAYSLRLYGNSNSATLAFSGMSTIYVRLRYRIIANGGGAPRIIEFKNASDVTLADVFHASSGILTLANGTTTASTTTPTFTQVGVAYTLYARYTSGGGSNGISSMYIVAGDGTKGTDQISITTGNAMTDCTKLFFGTNRSTADLLIDELSYSASPIP